jgi:hypothetical protein
MSKAPFANPFTPGHPLPTTSIPRAGGGLLPINTTMKPPSPAKLKPKGAPAGLFNPGQAANPMFAAQAANPLYPVQAANPLFPGQPVAAGPALGMGVMGGAHAAMPVMQMPAMPLQAVFQAAPVQTRHQKADVAKEAFKSGATAIVTNFVTQILPQASGNTVQSCQHLLMSLQSFVQQHFQGVASRCVFVRAITLPAHAHALPATA